MNCVGCAAAIVIPLEAGLPRRGGGPSWPQASGEGGPRRGNGREAGWGCLAMSFWRRKLEMYLMYKYKICLKCAQVQVGVGVHL